MCADKDCSSTTVYTAISNVRSRTLIFPLCVVLTCTSDTHPCMYNSNWPLSQLAANLQQTLTPRLLTILRSHVYLLVHFLHSRQTRWHMKFQFASNIRQNLTRHTYLKSPLWMTQFMVSNFLHLAQPNILMMTAVFLHVTACRLVELLPNGRRWMQQAPHPHPFLLLILLSAVPDVSRRRSAQAITKFSLLATRYSILSLMSTRSTTFYITIHCLPFSPVSAK